MRHEASDEARACFLAELDEAITALIHAGWEGGVGADDPDYGEFAEVAAEAVKRLLLTEIVAPTDPGPRPMWEALDAVVDRIARGQWLSDSMWPR